MKKKLNSKLKKFLNVFKVKGKPYPGDIWRKISALHKELYEKHK